MVVTKDTRSKSKKNKLCWALCLGVIAAAIILAILALAGVFSKTEPTPVEARQFGDKDVKTGSIFPVASGDKQAYNTTERIEQIETTPTSEPSSSTPNDYEKNEEDDYEDPFSSINYVDNSLEGQVTLMDATFDTQYDDKNSEAYKSLVSELEREIKKILNKDNNEQYHVKILDLK